MIKLWPLLVVEEFIPYTFFKIFPGERWGSKSGGPLTPLEPNNGDRLIKISRVVGSESESITDLGSVVSAAAESERARCICC
jgi:hypothetical protein